MTELKHEGEFKHRIKKFLRDWDVQEWAEEEFWKQFDEAKKDFLLAIKHLKHRGIESPYVESIVDKWFGDK